MPRIVFSLLLIACLSPAALSAQSSEDGGKVEIKAPDVIDNADLMTPKDSFQYWLDTVSLDDAAFRQLVIRSEGLEANTPFTDEQLRLKRIERLISSFDFDERIKILREEMIKDSVTPSESDLLYERRQLVEQFLSDKARATYNKRNIKALSAPTPPDFEAGTAWIYVTLLDLVEESERTYKVHLKRYDKGLMWRWYKSELVTDKIEQETKPATTAEATMKVDEEIGRLSEELRKLDAEAAAIETKKRELRIELRRKQEERDEIQRALDPYATPEISWATARRALDRNDWQAFLAVHTKRVRDAAGDRAKTTFEESRQQIFSAEIIPREEESRDPNKATLKLKLTLRYRKEVIYEEDGEPIEEDKSESRVITINFVREGNKWLIDDDL